MKKVLVQVSDKNYLQHSKSLFVNANLQGKWDGDYCLIANNIDQDDLKDFKDTPIKIFHVNNPNCYYAKLDVFDIYFKNWDYVLFMDSDIIILGDIGKEPTPNENTIIMDYDSPFKISQYFCQKCNEFEKNIKLNELKMKYSFIDDFGYNSGFFYLNTSLITNNTKNELLKLQDELSEINNHGVIGTDQPIINIYFKKYIDSNSFCKFWRTPEHQMRKALHFCHGEAPWINDTYSNILNKTYRQQYIENLQAFNSVMKVK